MRTASSVYFSSMRQVILISEVEIILMLMFSLLRARKAREATPEWLRMPTPMTETLATAESWRISSQPISSRRLSRILSVGSTSARGTVKVMSVRPSLLGFCTIMSTRMRFSAMGAKTAAETPGRSWTRVRVMRAWSLS